MKSYSELIKFSTFEERLNYLYIGDKIGDETFGCNRHINQTFYKSPIWRKERNGIILRDKGCNIGLEGFDLASNDIIIHHINPISIDDIINCNPCILDPENLIAVSRKTHRQIHYGTSITDNKLVTRFENDTCPWRR